MSNTQVGKIYQLSIAQALKEANRLGQEDMKRRVVNVVKQSMRDNEDMYVTLSDIENLTVEGEK